MRCLYCGKELALLKRLTGGGEFCSDAHKQSYQEEYNRLALSRLLQAQARGAKAAQAGSVAASKPAAPVALAEAPAAVEEPLAALPEAEPQAPHAEPDESPSAIAGFLFERPAIVAMAEGSGYTLEPWFDEPGSPALPEWHFEEGISALSFAGLVPLVVQPRLGREESSAGGVKVSPKEYSSGGKVDLSVPLTVTSNHDLPSAPVIPMDFPVQPPETGPATNAQPALAFRTEVILRSVEFLEPPPSAIEFVADESSVAIPDSWFDGHVSGHSQQPAADSSTWVEPDATPRAALAALSRLHQNLIEREDEADTEEPAPAAVASSPIRINVVASHTVSEPSAAVAVLLEAPVEADLVEAEQPVIEIEAVSEVVEVSAAAAAPADAPVEDRGLVEIPVRDYPPSREALAFEGATGIGGFPLLPRLKSLPLRPKVALAPPGWVVQSREPASSSPYREAKLRTRDNAPEDKVESVPAAPSELEKQPQKPVEVTPPSTTREARPRGASKESSRKRPPEPEQEGTAPLTFEALELQLMADTKPPFWGSLKVKLSIAIILLLGAGAAYKGLGTKDAPHATSPDGPGPSIMVGEGGWVQNWAGDPIGARAGREVTIYRPSLKLTDYRIEFVGQIDAKSVGWVFRAPDPNNYYAMKLAQLGASLPMKVALFKYLVRNGHETEVGRVGLDIPVAADTAFRVRVDVRGAKFNTYVQGQPVDVWTDDQLKTGGVGFLNERGERARIKSVSISYLSDGMK